nr:hypothetical protein [Tanacetum cinerariifolium]
MNPRETQLVIARDEKWVPSTERVKIGSINVRLEPTMQQKEETFQVTTPRASRHSLSLQKSLRYLCSISGTPSRRKRTASRRMVKNKVLISKTDNIIPDPDVALKLEDSQVLKAQVKELVGYQGFSMSPQSSLLPQVNELSEYSEEDQSKDEEIDWIDSEDDDEKKDYIDDNKSINLEMTDDKETDDEVLQGEEQVNDDEDKEMKNAEVEESINDNKEAIDAAKADAEKNEEAKDDPKKAKLPPTSSSLSVSSDAEINYILDIKIQSEVSHIQSPSVLRVPVSLRVTKLEKDVSELEKIDHSAKALASLKSQVPTIFEHYLGSKIGDDLQKGVTNTVKNHKRQHDDDDNDDDEDPSARPNHGKKIKRQRTKESKSFKKPSTTKETSKGKAPSKGSKPGKSASAKEPVEEPIAEVVIDDAVNTAGEDVVRDDQPQDTLEPTTNKTPSQDWFKQPPRPSTPNSE